MNTFRVTYTNGQHYYTQANGTAAEFEAYLKQDGGRVTFEDSNDKETHLWIDRVEEVERRWYKLQGTYRDRLGVDRAFYSQVVRSENPRTAMDNNRQDLVDLGYDYILYKRVFVRDGDAGTWTEIPMLEALGRE